MKYIYQKMFHMLRIVQFYSIMLLCIACTSSYRSRIETLVLNSKVFDNNRTLRIYLPKEYDGKRTFKVLYLNDGQNLFGDNELGSKNEWRVDEILDSLLRNNVIEPIIVVDIDNAGRDRANEYLPWADIYLSPPIRKPNGKKYPEFLIGEVMPAIERNYKIRRGKENTGIGGSSYGGLISMYCNSKTC